MSSVKAFYKSIIESLSILYDETKKQIYSPRSDRVALLEGFYLNFWYLLTWSRLILEAVDELASPEEKQLFKSNDEVGNYIRFSLYGIAAAAAKWLGEIDISKYMAERAMEFGRRNESRELYRVYIDQSSTFTELAVEAGSNNGEVVQELDDQYSSKKGRVHFFPRDLGKGLTKETVRSFAEEHFKEFSAPKFSASTKVLTVGSCFAENVALSLQRKAGIKVDSFGLHENINNPKTLNSLLEASLRESLQSGSVSEEYSESNYLIKAIGKIKLNKFAATLRESDIVIVTLGVSCWLSCDSSSKTFFVKPKKDLLTNLKYPSGDYRLRSMDVNEVKQEIDLFMRKLRLVNSDCSVVFTVSPVPASGFDNIEVQSMLSADLLSKSTLYCACQEYIRECPEDRVFYWPSFEIVRGISPWLDFRSFGLEDNSPRHPSDVLVDIATDLFAVDR